MATQRQTTSSERAWCLCSSIIYIDDRHRAIVRTLNANYSDQTYGIGLANTRYPISAFITDIVYLKGTKVAVDVQAITVSSSSDRGEGKY